jgi:hypothetical protein
MKQVSYLCTDYKRYVTSSNDMMLIKLLAFFLLFKNSEAFARSSLDNIFIQLLHTLPLLHYTTESASSAVNRPSANSTDGTDCVQSAVQLYATDCQNDGSRECRKEILTEINIECPSP